jgi:hypothetical protein
MDGTKNSPYGFPGPISLAGNQQMNLAVRTCKQWTFTDFKTCLKLLLSEVAQGRRAFEKEEKKQAITMASMKSRFRPAHEAKAPHASRSVMRNFELND